MGQSKRRQKKGGVFRPSSWLPVLIVATLVLLGAIAIVWGQNGKEKSTSSDPIQVDPNFTPAVTGAPRVAVSQDYIDYGDVKLGTTVTTTFDVQNTGDLPLVILGEPRVELIEGC